ncbi:MAG: glycosyltransferase family 4 protein, partial [Acidobacteriia bacterium]|nr:glycosyltransferase family 4 protein [Terriglobia bacterium]
MTIALDATYSLGNDLSGVGIYSRELMAGLARQHPEIPFLYCYRPHRFLRSWRDSVPANARRALLAEPFGPRSAALFHGLNQRLPAMRLRRMVATFHDLFVLSGDYSTPEFRARFAAQARDAAARADLIVAVSHFTKSQVTGLLGVEEKRVRVVHHGIRPLAIQGGRPEARERIVLHVGAIQKRKNIERLMEAFESLDESWKLVLVGSAGYGAQRILERIRSSPASARIHVAGYVSAEELAKWYSRASIFAFPSLDEGFGMPVLEAMAAGIPVLTSNRSSLPEAAGDAALLVNPEDIDAIREALVRLAQSPELRARLVEWGYARMKLFSWDKASAETWQA